MDNPEVAALIETLRREKEEAQRNAEEAQRNAEAYRVMYEDERRAAKKQRKRPARFERGSTVKERRLGQYAERRLKADPVTLDTNLGSGDTRY